MAERILVIDDDEEIAELLGVLLTKKGYEAEVAFTGAQALQKAADFRPAVIIQDYMLPDIKGMDLLYDLKKTLPEVMVVVITARGSETVAVDMLKAGASDYIKKPFDAENLVGTVDRLLRLKSSELECNRLSSELNRQNRELLGINALSSALTSAMDRESKCSSAVGIIMNNMRADLANVFAVGYGGNGLKLVASHGMGGEGLEEQDLPGNMGIAAYIREIKKPAVITDLAKEQRIKIPGRLLKFSMTSALAVPMMYKDSFRGVLEVYTKEPRTYSAFDIKLLSSFANLIAMALENEELERSLVLAESRWQSFCDTATDRITVQDSWHKIVSANAAAAEAAGMDIDGLVGQQCCWMFHNTREPVKDCPVAEVFRTKKPVSREIRMEGTGRSYHIDAYPVFGPEGEIEMVVERGRKLD